MASSTTLQLDKSSWPSQILLVCRLGKRRVTQETQTLPAPNHTPYCTNTPTLLLYDASSSRALAHTDILEDEYVAWEGGSAWCLSGPLKRLAYSRIDLSLLQHQSTSQAKHGTTRHFPDSISLLGTLGPGDRRLCMRLVLVSFTLIYSCCYYSTMRHSTIDLSLFNTSEESLRD